MLTEDEKKQLEFLQSKMSQQNAQYDDDTALHAGIDNLANAIQSCMDALGMLAVKVDALEKDYRVLEKTSIGFLTAWDGEYRSKQRVDGIEALKGKYQAFTQADLAKLRGAGYKDEFATVEQGVRQYVEWLAKHA